jgi:hypothetical protein
MDTLFTIIYLFFLFLLCLGALFILYHLLRYSLSKTLGLMGVLFFSIIFCVLVVANVSTFRNIDLDKTFNGLDNTDFLPQSKFAPTPKTSLPTNPW